MSVRTRLVLCCGGLAFVVGGILLGVVYLAIGASVDESPLGDTGTVVESQPPSQRDAVAYKEQLVAADAAVRREADARIRAAFLGPGAVALGVLTVGGFAAGALIAGSTLRPLRRITETARRIAERNLDERLPQAGARDEWGQLAAAFNAMLSRLDAAFAAQSQFVGNASHELKTPLAINQTLLEVAMGRPDAPPEVLRLGETLLEVNARHERLVDGLLALARAGHRLTNPQPVELAGVVDAALAFLRPEAEQLGLEVIAETTVVVVDGDRVLLDRLVQNLVQNAIRHNRPQGWLRVELRAVDGQARLTVVNTGAEIAAGRVPELFQPFQRATNRVRTARGTGLGLSIAQSVTRAHRGSLSASPRPGGGLEIELTIPASVPYVSRDHEDSATVQRLVRRLR